VLVNCRNETRQPVSKNPGRHCDAKGMSRVLVPFVATFTRRQVVARGWLLPSSA
jgi:hypothetical protein